MFEKYGIPKEIFFYLDPGEFAKALQKMNIIEPGAPNGVVWGKKESYKSHELIPWSHGFFPQTTLYSVLRFIFASFKHPLPQ